MALIGISLLVASFVILCLRPPAWLPNLLASLRHHQGTIAAAPPPPQPPIAPPSPTAQEDNGDGDGADTKATEPPDDEQTTPKAAAMTTTTTTSNDDDEATIPSLILSEPTSHAAAPTAPPSIPPPTLRQPSPSVLMPPPPIPPQKKPKPSGIPRIPTLASPNPAAAATSSAFRARNLPIPARSAGGSSSASLAPPPTATSVPKKPSRQVALAPGHSPLDWARLAQAPTSDLRNLPPGTPYLRVTPAMLKQQNGRKGRDAWTVYGGKVYNVSPYAAFHPGGGPELLRGAGKDGTRLFAEVHPWVNYETMLASCLIGLLVDEGEAASQMEEMD